MSIDRSASDAELLAALPHDVAAFEAFYRRYVRRVMGFAVKRCSSAEDAADVVAHTFVRLLSAARRYDPNRAQPSTFVLGVAANVVRDQRRHNARHRALVTKLAGRGLLEADDIVAVDAAIDAASTARSLTGALATVPPGEQEVLRLVAAGQTPGQAATALGISATAARARLSRARRRLRGHLSPTDKENET
jgi:RNA polymerase sigma-70 factor (ECF subfamily)